MVFGKVQLENYEADAMFEKTFGTAGICPEQTYYDPLNKVDMRKNIGDNLLKGMMQKAPSMSTTSGGTYTGYGLMPPFVDPDIVDRTAAQTPLVRMIPRKAIRGRSYVYNVVTAKAGAAFANDDDALSEQVDTRSTATTNMKYLYAVGRVTGPSLASGEGFINLLAEDIRIKVASMNEALEDQIINGTTSADANGFAGLIDSITTNSTAVSAAVDLDDCRTILATIFHAYGDPKIAVTDGYTHNFIKGLLMDYQRYVEHPPEDMAQLGFPGAFVLDGVTFIRDQYMPTTSGSRRILFIDLRYVYLAVLQDVTFEEMARVNDSQKYFLKWYGSLVITFEAACGQLTTIT